MNNKIVFFIPAAGKGSRLYPLTKNQSKPSLPIFFDDNGYIKRMIELQFDICLTFGATAIVSQYYCKESLHFINDFSFVKVINPKDPWIDNTLMELVLNDTIVDADILCYLPADTYVTTKTIEKLIEAVDSETFGALLCTLQTEGHNTRFFSEDKTLVIGSNGYLCGDLGIYAINWKLFSQETKRKGKVDILRGWETICNSFPIKIIIPENGPTNVDLGTPRAYYDFLVALNKSRIDNRGNIIFPGASINEKSLNCIALPNSCSTSLELERSIIPENGLIHDANSVLHILY